MADKSKAKAKVENTIDAKQAEAQALQAEANQLDAADPHKLAEQKQAEASVAQAEADKLADAYVPINDPQALKKQSEIVEAQEEEVRKRLAEHEDS